MVHFSTFQLTVLALRPEIPPGKHTTYNFSCSEQRPELATALWT